MSDDTPARGWSAFGGKQLRIRAFEKLYDHIDSSFFVERALWKFFVILLLISTVALLGLLNERILVEVPAHGGSITEGATGAPRFINPLLALSDSDRDLTELVYSGLLAATPSGNLVPNLASNFTISDDGLVYTFTLRDDARFHDNSLVTADDVVFTITLAQDPTLRSPKRANWEGVSVEKLSDTQVQFILPSAYAPFLENATLGILPKHLWKDVSPEQLPFSTFNVEPVGSGAYMVVESERNRAGVPQYYRLVAFDDYVRGKPYIENLTMRFYSNDSDLEQAFRHGEVNNINAISPTLAAELVANNKRVETYPLPRVFGVFFNQDNAPLFANREVRVALDTAVDRKQIVNDVLAGYGVPTDGPLPPGVFPSSTDINEDENTTNENRIESAQNILIRNGWEFDEALGLMKKETKNEDFLLSFSISTSNIPELMHTAELLKASWEQIGASIELKFFDPGSLSNDVIRPRNYNTLLFGQIIGRDRDPFAFWHSSQRNDPGLNVALYANISADSVLENIRKTFDSNERADLYDDFEKEVREDVPAVFLYAPDFIYVVNNHLKGLTLGTVTTPAERFLNINEWHLETQKVWPFFAPNN